eukprot:3436107-Alexandrium_andersonii.AAC.1
MNGDCIGTASGLHADYRRIEWVSNRNCVKTAYKQNIDCPLDGLEIHPGCAGFWSEVNGA